MENYYAVIMAGGGGTRLWPLSRKERPKQLLRLVSERSMFQIAIDRLLRVFPTDRILIVTIAAQVDALHAEFPSIPLENFIIEPMPKGTASVVGLAATYLLERDPQAIMAVLTADHVIENVSMFHDLLEKGRQLAEKKHLITLGIEPTYAATGYGYIQAGEALDDGTGWRVDQFVEKPDEKTAQAYLESGKYFWNSGMFIWKASVIMEEFSRQMPALFTSLQEIGEHLKKGDAEQAIPGIWAQIKPQTIDYGVMEHAQDVVVLPARNLGWNDVGSWDSLFEILEADTNGNVIQSKNVININSRNNLYHSEESDKLIALVDIDDLVIIDSGKALLVCKKGQTQKIKQIVEELKQKDLDTYL
ncbi:MAG: mannose-phosphate guanylyltransferase [Chloroflexota bacterium]|nr:mannose-phosphate guanylyltransferase [Chloroflexota bacterium]